MKRTVLSLIATVIAITCSSQILWEVSGNGLEKPSYIMGTHHFAPVSILDSIPEFNKAITGCDVIYGEMEESDMNSPQAQQKMVMAAMAPADSMLNMIYTPEQFDSIDTVIKKYTAGQASLQQMSMLKPAMIGIQLTLLQTMKAFPDFNPQQQLDITVQQKGKELGKPLNGFETTDFQVGILFGKPISRQAKDLLKMVANDDKMYEYSHKLADAYMSQNLDLLLEIMSDPETGSDEDDMNRLVYSRNAAWRDTLVKLMPDKSVFVCVGAGHLPGDKGLLNLLRQEGYNVKPAGSK